MAIANVSFATKGETLYAYLEGEIDHDSAQVLRNAIDATLIGVYPKCLVMDFGQVGFMDSSGLGLILGRKRRIEAMDGVLRVQHPPVQVEKVLRLVDIESVEV